jgi:hypothetical protein
LAINVRISELTTDADKSGKPKTKKATRKRKTRTVGLTNSPRGKPPVRHKPKRRRTKPAAKETELKSPATNATTVSAALPEGISRGMIGNARRAARKANIPDASEAFIIDFECTLLADNVTVIQRTSNKLAKVLHGELETKDLN